MIRELKKGEVENVSGLIRKVFDQYVGSGYSREGTRTFYDYIAPKAIMSRMEEGNIFLVNREEEVLTGVIEVRKKNHICLFFVDSTYQGRGTGRKLFEAVVQKVRDNSDFLEVNSSPFAVEIYQKLGFKKAGEETTKDGIIFIPMRLDL